MIPKHQYVRNKKLLKLVADLDCQLCGSAHMVQAEQAANEQLRLDLKDAMRMARKQILEDNRV